MKFGQYFRYLFVVPVNFPDAIHRHHLQSSCRRHLCECLSTGYFPIVALMPSQTAPTKPVTMMVMAALKV